MRRISTATRVVDKFGAGKDGFTNGDVIGGVPATDLEDVWFDHVQEELCNIVEKAGIALSGATRTQVLQAVKRLFGGNVTTVNLANTGLALTADHAGLVLMDATAGNISVTMPAASVLTESAAKFRFVRVDATANTATGSRAGADTFVGGATSFSLIGQGDFRVFESDLVSKWATTAQSATKQLISATATVAANALTLGVAASQMDFRNAALTNGTTTTVSFGALSLVVPSGATLGTVNGVQSRVMVLLLNNAGSAELAVVNLAGGVNLDETGVISTTAISGASNSAAVVYSTTARANVPYRVAFAVDSTQAAAGTWATAPTLIQAVGGQALACMSSLGYSQTLQNLAGSRALGTTYYNTTGKPIFVKVVLSNGSGSVSTFQSTVEGVAFNSDSAPIGGYAVADFIVRPGQSYQSTNPGGFSIVQWLEVR